MRHSIDPRLVDVHPKPLGIRGEGLPLKVGMNDFKALIGGAIERALEKSGISRKTASFVMGYGEDQSSIRKWIEGKETPQFARLWLLGETFQQALVVSLASIAGADVEIRRVVTIAQRRAVNA
jgi:hypothetical protein